MLAATLGFAPRAAAQGDDPPELDKVRIEYRAPAECPDVEAFKALIRGRVPPGWEAAPGEFARRVVVEVSRSDDRYLATVEVADEQGQRGVKTVTGTLCANVVDGMALVTALAIQSRGQEPTELAEPAVAEPSAAPVKTPPVPPRAPAAPPPPRGPGTGSPSPSAAGDRGSLARRNPAAPLGLRISARVALATGVGPSAAPGVGLGLVWERRRARLGLTLQGFRTGRVQVQRVPAELQLLSARAEGCPFLVVLAEWASLEPCAFVELGAIQGRAFEAPPAVIVGERGTAPWVSAGGVGRWVGRFGWLVLEVEALLGVPLWRERFYVERGDEVHRVPAYYLGGAAGLGVRF